MFMDIYGNDVPEATEENRAEASDILWQSTPIDIKADTLQPVLVEFAIPKTAKSGTYKTQLTVTADRLDKPLVFEYEVRVQNAELPDNYRDTFDIELDENEVTKITTLEEALKLLEELQ